MAKKNTNPTTFDSLLNNVYGNPEGTTEVSDMDAQDEFKDIVVEDDNEPAVQNTVEDNTADDANPSNDDDSNIPQNVLDKMNNSSNDEPIEEPIDNQQDVDNSEPSNEDITEALQVGLLFDAIGLQFGWNTEDIDEQDRPLTVEDLTNYMGEVIKLNSRPQYADDRIQQLDEYVKKGGKFEDFYQSQLKQLSYDNIDMEDESNQKAVVTELLKYSGYTDEQIRNKISRYEDADMLEDESTDALERLKQIKQSELEYQQQQQEYMMQLQEELNKRFYQNCTDLINSLTSIHGVQIPQADRKKLIDYIFNVDQNGVSKFQRDYNNQDTFINNLITTAYMTMKGDSFVSTAKRDGESSATEKLRKLLRHSSRNHSAYNADEKPKSVIDITSKYF